MNNQNLECVDTTKNIEMKSVNETSSGIIKISGIYKIVNKIDNKYYVGSSKSILGGHGRWANHKRNLKYNNHDNSKLQCAYNKYGKDNFDFIIVERYIGNDKKELLTIEQKYLDIAKNEQDKCYNLSFDAFGSKYLSLESRQKLSKSLKGRTFSDESKKKMSIARIGWKCSNQAKDNMSKAKSGVNHPLYGKHHSDETKNKMRIHHKYAYDCTIHTFVNKITLETFTGTQYDFVIKHKLNKGNVCQMILGKSYRKSINGWTVII